MLTFIYILIKYINDLVKQRYTSICNRIFWSKIPHFIIESDAKRISFLKTPPPLPPLKAKFILRVFSIVIYHIYSKGFVVSRGGGGICLQHYIPKKSFCFVTFQKLFNKYEWKWKFITLFCFYWYDFHQMKPLLDHPFLFTFCCNFSDVCFNRFMGIKAPI